MSTELTIEDKLDRLMEASHLQIQLLQQVLLSYDNLLKKLVVVQNKENLIKPSKEIIT